MPTALTRCVLLGIALVAHGCSDKDTRGDRTTPASTAVADLLPPAAAKATFRAVPGSAFALRSASALPMVTPGAIVARYEASSTHPKATATESSSRWSFGVDEEGLRAKLGEPALAAGRANLSAALRGLLARTELRGALAAALDAAPAFSRTDADGAWDVDHLAIEAISLSDGLDTDQDGDGTHETPRSLLTLTLRLPAVELARPATPYPACNALLGDGSVASALAARDGRAYVAAASASWAYQLGVVVHVTLEDLAAAHASLRGAPTPYVSVGERNAAAHDLAIFRDFLASPSTHLPGADLAITFMATPALARGTLSIVAAVAREAHNADCLREVDAWLLETGLVLPRVSADQLSGAAAPSYLVHSYDGGMDALDGIVHGGLGCLHDAQGKVVQVGSDALACSTPSGPIGLGTQALASFPPGARSLTPVTPYDRDAATASLPFASCEDAVWATFCSGRFGRGIRLCLSEWAIRGQVGDHWNIHWYQSPWKATVQTAIMAVTWLVRAGVIATLGDGRILVALQSIAVQQGSVAVLKKVEDAFNFKIAGYQLSFGAAAAKLIIGNWFAQTPVSYVGVDQVIAGFVVARVVNALGQMAEVEAVGWQDQAGGSCGWCGFECK